MDQRNQQNALGGSNLQNGQSVQNGQSTDNLQQQNRYTQLQQDALGSDAYRNFDGLRVQDARGQTLTTGSSATTTPKNANVWPSVFLVAAVFAALLIWVYRSRLSGRSKQSVVPSSATPVPEVVAEDAQHIQTESAVYSPGASESTESKKSKKSRSKAKKKR